MDNNNSKDLSLDPATTVVQGTMIKSIKDAQQFGAMMNPFAQPIDLRKIVEKVFLDESFKNSKEDLFRIIGDLVLERLDQLLEKDTDEIVRILIENKLFKDENTGLKQQIDNLNNRIDKQQKIIDLLELRIKSLEFHQQPISIPSPYTKPWEDFPNIGGTGTIAYNTVPHTGEVLSCDDNAEKTTDQIPPKAL